MKKYLLGLGAVWAVIILMNLLAWFSVPFSDFYVAHIFPIWVVTYGRLTGLFPFSVGEWMLYLAVIYIVVNLILIFPAVFLRKRPGGKRLLRILAVCPGFITLVCLIMTLNCTILYHTSPLEQAIDALDADGNADRPGVSPAGEDTDRRGMSLAGENTDRPGVLSERENADELEELVALREMLVNQCNELSLIMPRDERGYVVIENGMDTADNPAYYREIARDAGDAMRGISGRFPRLTGYYPEPKPFWASWFFSQQYMCGYYFPFSMEANYNNMMYIMNIPFTMCHELAHLRGYIQENEANFLAYLACVESGDPLFVYSGCLNVMTYVERDLAEALRTANDPQLQASLTPISGLVMTDQRFLTPEAWEEVETVSFLDTQTVARISDDFLETNLNLNGVSEGTVSYSRVVELLLLYYK